ncbi:hypothetical protein CA850_24910 [Micromonospora echinospora]|uniref:Uncharacterized protein n=1 Tax=Micromonospora echinospora TaxID=1877 RepID=A0A1C4ZIY7_MICEC|nr:hypothetical protein [Micromonospora echinospora]OZV77012.1 hypothetical protein CA850_24910 [Micromonospora echinospora]SCF32845.1 hypothetical protein GA0070618_5315 [Micromonospora echinospora]
MREEFRLGGVDLGMDGDRSSVVISASGILTAELSAATTPAGTSEWALAPPLLYFRGVPLTPAGDTMTLTVDDDASDDYDIALYFIGHRDVRGTLTVRPDGLLIFTGLVTSDGVNPAQQLTVSQRLRGMGD